MMGEQDGATRQILALHEAETRLRKIVEQVLDDRTDLIRKAVRVELDEWGTRIGLNTGDPLTQQDDFKHLRRWRAIVESTGMRVAITTVSLLVSAFLGLIWLSVARGWSK